MYRTAEFLVNTSGTKGGKKQFMVQTTGASGM
jgi:hypothetical protein